MKILGPRVLIKPIEDSQPKAGQLLLMKEDKQQVEGEVIEVGTKYDRATAEPIDFPVKVGEKVLYSKYDARLIEIEGKTFHIVNCDVLIGVLE